MNDATLWENKKMKKEKIEIVQINLGNKCNLSCCHCHIAASPAGKNNMDSETACKIISHLVNSNVSAIEFTGGAPELNPNLQMFIEDLAKAGKNLTVRTNLTVLDAADYSFFADLFKKYSVKVVASLPCVYEENVDRQRGEGVYKTSLKVLKRLNDLGYGLEEELALDLVYNPGGDFLPAPQPQLESLYKQTLKECGDITFNNLLTMVNAPIKRFKRCLQREGKLDGYMRLLADEYNPQTLANLMCRSLISVDYAGQMYDCDFNLALNLKIKGLENTRFWEVVLDSFDNELTFGEHCFACTAGVGSSCHGVLLSDDMKTESDERKTA